MPTQWKGGEASEGTKPADTLILGFKPAAAGEKKNSVVQATQSSILLWQLPQTNTGNLCINNEVKFIKESWSWVVLWIKARDSQMLGKLSTTELHPQSKTGLKK
jgi:hypothetical protein